MHAVFVACLFAGALATALFAILGHVGAGHGGSHAHASTSHVHASGHGASHAGAAHGHADSAHAHGGAHGSHAPGHAEGGHSWFSSSLAWSASWLSPLTLAAAALWFGAAGLLSESAAGRLAVFVAILAAILGAAVIRSVMGMFARASTPPLQLTGEGALGTVNAAILPNAPGEVIYTLEGLHRSVPARSDTGQAIPRGTSVVIVRKEGGFAWVAPLDPVVEVQTDVSIPVLGEAGSSEPARRADNEVVDTNG